jgi:hypothetical protein
MEEELQVDKTIWETSYTAKEKTLTKTETPEKIVPLKKSYDIEETQRKIDKIDGVTAQWEAKKAPLQEIIDKHQEVYNIK